MSEVCNGEFYSVPPKDHIARYEKAAAFLRDYKGTVLDVGCGGGYGAKILKGSGLTVVGVEKNKEAAKMAFDSCLDVVMADAATLDFTGKAVVMFEFIEHNEDGIMFFDKAIREADAVVASVPYLEPKGANEYHLLHDLSCSSFPATTPRTIFEICPDYACQSLMMFWRRA